MKCLCASNGLNDFVKYFRLSADPCCQTWCSACRGTAVSVARRSKVNFDTNSMRIGCQLHAILMHTQLPYLHARIFTSAYVDTCTRSTFWVSTPACSVYSCNSTSSGCRNSVCRRGFSPFADVAVCLRNFPGVFLSVIVPSYPLVHPFPSISVPLLCLSPLRCCVCACVRAFPLVSVLVLLCVCSRCCRCS